VFNEKAKKRAEKMSKKHKGVRKVINELTVSPQ
jgi:osmotically-inducible protein OsmY